MRKYLGYILLVIVVLALARPVAFASDRSAAGISSQTLTAGNTLSRALDDTPTVTATDTPVLIDTDTPTSSSTTTPTGTPLFTATPTSSATSTTESSATGATGASTPTVRAPNLGTAANFGVLAHTIASSGLTHVSGDIGVGTVGGLAGFPPGTLSGTIHDSDTVAVQAMTDLTNAYGDVVGRACGINLTGQDLGGLTLTSGVYCFNSSAQLTGNLTLDGNGNPNSVFIIQIGSTLTTASAAQILLINGAQASNIFWQIGSSATLGTYTEFAGYILAWTSVTITTGSTANGSIYAVNGTITLDTNDVQAPGFVPDPTGTPTLTGTPTPTATSTPTVRAPNLGTGASFGVLAHMVANSGFTHVSGDVGVSPGTGLAGFPPGTLSGTIHTGDTVAVQAMTDLTNAYGDVVGRACGINLTGQDLGGLTLTSGVYCFNSSAQLTGNLTLDGNGNPNSVFIIQIGSTLTTASAAQVLMTNGAQASNIFWQIGSSATLGTYSEFAGNLLAWTSVTVTTGTTSIGGLYAINGTITLDTNDVQAPGFEPEPTDTPTPVSTDTAVATDTPTLIATETHIETETPTVTPIPTSTRTNTPVPSDTSTSTATSTATTGSLPTINPQASDFTGVTLNGTNQTTIATLDSFVVSDLRGTGAGWHIMAQANQFTDVVGHPMALGSLKMSAPTVAGPGTLPVIATGPYTIDTGEPFQIARALPGTGMGVYTFSATTLTLSITSYAYAGTYASAVTISIVSSP